MEKLIACLKSPRNYLRFALSIVAVMVVLAAGGCGSNTVTLFVKQKPVKISLLQLAQMTPEWDAVRQLDQTNELVAAPVSSVDTAFAAPGVAISAGPSAIVASGSSVRARDEAARLQVDADRAVESVRARIETNQARLIKIAQEQGDRRIAEGVAQARRQAIQDYLAKVPQLMTEGAAQRTNLRVQAGALKVDADPKNARTAPDDYWGHLLAAREAALASLGQPETEAEIRARDEIAQAVAATKAKLEAATSAEIADYKQTLDTRKKAVIERQVDALQKESVELLAISNELDQELRQPVVVSQKLAAGSEKASPGEIDSASQDLVAAQATAAKVHFEQQRARLVNQILDVTQRRATVAAQGLGLKIVDWKSAHPDQAAMKALLTRMQSGSSINS